MMKRKALSVVLASLFFIGCGGGDGDNNNAGATPDTPQTDNQEAKFNISDIDTGYYGLIYDKDGKELKLDKEQVDEMQQTLIDEVMPMLTEEQQKSFTDAKEAFKAVTAVEDVDKVIFNNSLIDAMLTNTDKATQEKYFPSFRLFRHHTHMLYPISRLGDFSWLLDFLSQRSLIDHLILVPPVLLENDEYIQTCRENDVPIPPDWGSDQWVYQGRAETDFLQSRRTEVYAYEDPAVPGACMALPRWELSNTTGEEYISLLGIICQSQTSGKACFWDNISQETGARLTGGADLEFKIADIQNGDSLGENCTGCHRGKNVFLIHPGTAIDISGDYAIDPNVRYQPVSTQGWTNPPAYAEQGDGACAGCHEIGELSFGYCNMLLKKAANLTMPSAAAPAGWEGDETFYGTHIQAMIDAGCPE